MKAFLSWKKSWVYVGYRKQQVSVAFPSVCWFGWRTLTSAGFTISHRGRNKEIVICLFLRTQYLLSHCKHWVVCSREFADRTIFQTCSYKKHLFLTTRQLSKSKETRGSKEECFLCVTAPHTWLYLSVGVYTYLSSIKYKPPPEWSHLNQYNLFINIK